MKKIIVLLLLSFIFTNCQEQGYLHSDRPAPEAPAFKASMIESNKILENQVVATNIQLLKQKLAASGADCLL